MDAIATTGKRKSDEGGDVYITANADANLFASLSDENWKMISSFASPPDVYNLSLSSIHFFQEVSTDKPTSSSANSSSANAAAKSTTTGRRSKRLAAAASEKNAASSSNDDKKVLATSLLRASLLSSLGRVLENSKSGITLDAALKMGKLLPEGSCCIAGSSIVAACLGKDWSKSRNSSDVDVYCSARAAPEIRSWLVEHANCMFIGVDDTYIDFVSDRLLYVVDTKIHHVESWGSFAENLEDNSRGLGEAEYRERTIQWGKGAAEYADWKWKHSMQFGILGVVPVNDGTHDIKPKPGGELPFDFNGTGDIDLIVAKIGLPVSSLLDGFDLEICKASFDGKKFHIPDPHLTFAAKTRMEPNRRAVVGSYVTHHREPDDLYSMRAIELSRLASSTIRAVRRDVPNAPFYRLLDVAAALPDRYNPNAEPWDMRGSFTNDSVVQAKFAPSVQFHNWCRKLIERLRKYQKRGIDVVDAPTIADDFQINRYHIMSHGG